MFDLTGKTALVTGASGGIGGAIAKALHAQGATVVLSGTRQEALDAVKAELGSRAFTCLANLSDTASVRLARAVLRGMMKKRWGRIIQITSVVGETGNPGQGNYAAAKAGLVGMSKSLAAEVASRNITVNCVAPGFIQTAMTEVLTDQQKEAISTRIPAGRMGTPEEIAAAVVFLAAPESAYITGETVQINGCISMI